MIRYRKTCFRLFFIVFGVFLSSVLSAQHQDTVVRSTGFYIAPAITQATCTRDFQETKPAFGIQAGYRFINKIEHGLFIESGVNFSWMQSKLSKMSFQTIVYGNPYSYTKEGVNHRMFLNVPFLFGYQMPFGKVRFHASIGFALYAQLSNFNNVQYSPKKPYGVTDTETEGEVLSFGAGCLGIVKAGIAVPLTKRLQLHLLPSFNYRLVNFSHRSLNLFEIASYDDKGWMASLEISFMWAIDNKEKLLISKQELTPVHDYTYSYDPDKKKTPKLVKQKAFGYNNYLYVELGGSSLMYAINYERSLIRTNKLIWLARAGAGVLPYKYTFPFGTGIMMGSGENKLEFGLYACIENVISEEDELMVGLSPSVGYRFVNEDNFMIRLAFSPQYLFKTNELVPSVGISIGGGF